MNPFQIFIQPTPAARQTLPETHRDGWWDSESIVPRNRKNQRITVEGTSYVIREAREMKSSTSTTPSTRAQSGR